jgi:hypothetical protein
MSAPQKKKITTVRGHPRHVPISKKHPNGITIVRQHPGRLPGSTLTKEDIEKAFKSLPKKLDYPTAHRLSQKDADKYDDLIAFWIDYFNRKLVKPPLTPLDSNVFKALLASESDFRKDPKGNPVAIGIAQITPSTLEILQDPRGEAKEFIFKGIRQKDLKDPNIAIPLGVRWLFYKKDAAAGKLKQTPTSEEIILEYKGLLKSKSEYKDKALEKFRREYEKLTKK